jgi:spore germination protein GerM
MAVHNRTYIAWRHIGRILLVVVAIQAAMVMMPAHARVVGKQEVVQLYFGDSKKPFLTAEDRVMLIPEAPVIFGRMLVDELLKGSARGNLAVIPKGTTLNAFFLLDDGTAVVDFSAQFRENHPGSCRLEQLTLFSVVNTLALNVPEIHRVKLLIDGAEVRTLAGHLSLEFPFTADMLLTR